MCQIDNLTRLKVQIFLASSSVKLKEKIKDITDF